MSPSPSLVTSEVEASVMAEGGPVHSFKEAMRTATELGDLVAKVITRRNEKANEKYMGSRKKEEAQVTKAERQIAEIEAVLRIRREKIRVRKAELNAVLESQKREENEYIANTKKREARRKEAQRNLEEERIYGMVYGASFIDHLKIDSSTTLGRCYCPEGKIVASVDKKEEQCDFWNCPALKPKCDFLPPPKPLPRSRPTAPTPRPQPPVVRPPPVQRIETITAFSEPTGDLFPESEPTGDLFPETFAHGNYYVPSSEPTEDLFP